MLEYTGAVRAERSLALQMVNKQKEAFTMQDVFQRLLNLMAGGGEAFARPEISFDTTEFLNSCIT